MTPRQRDKSTNGNTYANSHADIDTYISDNHHANICNTVTLRAHEKYRLRVPISRLTQPHTPTL